MGCYAALIGRNRRFGTACYFHIHRAGMPDYSSISTARISNIVLYKCRYAERHDNIDTLYILMLKGRIRD